MYYVLQMADKLVRSARMHRRITLFGGIIMSNDYVFNDTLPVAPLKIAALESCRDLAEKVNSHIINFRRNDIEVLKSVRKIYSTAAMMLIPTCLTARARVSGSGESKRHRQ